MAQKKWGRVMISRSNRLEALLEQMKSLQVKIKSDVGIEDIWTNSKLYEMMIANEMRHQMIPGHSGTLDAVDEFGNEYEYKHFKERSSNHSWTFNDFSDKTIAKLNGVKAVIFGHIDDTSAPPNFDWAYIIPGPEVSDYLKTHTRSIENNRRMINLSPNQLETRVLAKKKTFVSLGEDRGPYFDYLNEIFELSVNLENASGVSNVLTSNKFWEVLVSIPLGHRVNGEQGGRAGAHDAFDDQGRNYEYKVSKRPTWSFQDISDNVLNKYFQCEDIILSVVDKENFKVDRIYAAKPLDVVPLLREKLAKRESSAKLRGVELRRRQASLAGGDLPRIKARRLL